MSMRGPVYRGEIHAAPINNTETPVQELTADRIHILNDKYCHCSYIDRALDRVGDRSLKAEV
jgi:hypothetical protein